MAIPKRIPGIPEDAHGIPQAIASTMPSQCHQQIHSLVFIWETRLWFSKMENTTLVFLKWKCTHGLLPEKPPHRHNSHQNASTVFGGINPFPTLTMPSQPIQTPQNESQKIMPLVFFVFRENFIHAYLHETAQSHVTILFCYRRFFSFSEQSASDFFVTSNRRDGNPGRKVTARSPLGHGIAARSTPKQRKKRAFRCVFHTKRAIFHS